MLLTKDSRYILSAVWAHRFEVELAGVYVPVRSPVRSQEHVIQSKTALGRTQGLADVEPLVGGSSEQA
jgi:hypothetical protein